MEKCVLSQMHISQQRRVTVEKIAVIEIQTTSVKLQIVDIIRNKYFEINRVMEMPINLTKDFYTDMFIKPNVTKEINNILLVYKKTIEQYECTETICFASDIVSEAKNQNGFLNELFVVSGFKFEVMDKDQEMNYVYTSVINSFNRPKGVIVNVGDYNTEIVVYNRRNILHKLIIPYGSVKLYDEGNSSTFEEREQKIKAVVDQMFEESGIKNDIPEEFDIIGCGQVFKDYGVICRKARKYPIDLSHNFVSSRNDFEKVYTLIRGFDVGTSTKIKGIALHNSKYFPCGLQIIKAILDNFEKEEFVISKLGRIDGVLFNKVIPLTLEKPISDTLGYSLQVMNDYYDRKPNNSQHIYEISMILFKQLKVLHKLPRPYVKVLRIASYLINSGYRVDLENADKVVFDVINNSTIYGVGHTEIVLAGFVALCKNMDNFNLSEWVRFKEYLTDEDLVAVKKLSVILKIAEALDITGFGSVVDISCDILGDSVIMKTIVEQDASFEIAYTMLCGSEFKKAFGKNLEVL